MSILHFLHYKRHIALGCIWHPSAFRIFGLVVIFFHYYYDCKTNSPSRITIFEEDLSMIQFIYAKRLAEKCLNLSVSPLSLYINGHLALPSESCPVFPAGRRTGHGPPYLCPQKRSFDTSGFRRAYWPGCTLAAVPGGCPGLAGKPAS